MKKVISIILSILITICSTPIYATAMDEHNHNIATNISSDKSYEYDYCTDSGEYSFTMPTVSYPESSHNYSNTIDEVYEYSSSGADSLLVSFSSDSYTEKDYDIVSIYDKNDNLVGKYSGEELSSLKLKIDGDSFTIKFTTDRSKTFYGFKIDEVSAFHGDFSIILPNETLPESEHNYKDRQTTTQYYSCAGASSMTLTFSPLCLTEFDCDIVYVYDYATEKTTQYSGDLFKSKSITINGDKVKITFKTDWDTNFYGYKIDNIEITTSSTSKVIENPETTVNVPIQYYPESEHNYSNSEYRSYSFNYPNAKSLRLHFSSQTKSEYGYDYITIYDGDNNQIGRYSGRQLANEIIEIPTGSFNITLYSDRNTTYYGFSFDLIEANLITNPMESDNESVKNTSVIAPSTSHDYESHSNETMVYTDYNAQSMNIKFSSQTKTEYNYDFIYIYDGNDNLIGKYSGRQLASEIITINSPTVRIVFNSDGSYNYYGYSIDYIESVYDKDNVIRDTHAYPESNHNYSDDTLEKYSYSYDKEKVKGLAIVFSNKTYTENGFDFIKIYDSSNNFIDGGSGNHFKNKIVLVPGNSFNMTLESEREANYYGFSIEKIIAIYDTDYYAEHEIAHNYVKSGSIKSTDSTFGFDYYICTNCFNQKREITDGPVVEKVDNISLSPSNNGVTVFWDSVDNVDGYEIQISNDNNFTNYISEDMPDKEYSARRFDNLTTGQTYYIRILSYKSIEGSKAYSEPSDTKSITASSIIYSTYDNGYTEDSYIVDGESIDIDGLSHTGKIPVKENMVYYFNTPYHYSTQPLYDPFPPVTMYYKDGTTVTYSALQLKDMDGCRVDDKIHGTFFDYAYLTVPKGVKYIEINFDSRLTALEIYEQYNPYSIEVEYSSVITSTNYLKNKSMLVYGTSIAEGGACDFCTFDRYIAGANDMYLSNRGISGANSSQYLDELINGQENPNDYDIILVEGFANDCENKVPLGKLTPNGTTKFDKETYIGMLEWAIYNYQQSGYSAKLVFLLTPKLPGLYSIGQNKYWNAAISVFEKYNIPYCNTYDLEVKTVLEDHPDKQGNVLIAQRLEPFLNSLFE